MQDNCQTGAGPLIRQVILSSLEVLFDRVNHMMSAQNFRQRHSYFRSNTNNQQTNGTPSASMNQLIQMDLAKSILIIEIIIILF